MTRCSFCEASVNELPQSNPPAFLLGKNSKIRKKGRSTFDLPPGDPEHGGFCLSRTPACESCYATLGAIIFGSADERRALNAQVFHETPAVFIERLVGEIRDSRAPIIRIHGFGDFFSTEYVDAWAAIVTSLPKVRFFGTTRMWLAALQPTPTMKQISGSRLDIQSGIGSVEQWRRDRDEFLAALDRFRSIPNVSIGASVEGAVYMSSHEPFVPGDPLCSRISGAGKRTTNSPNARFRVFKRGPFEGKTVVEYLHAHGFNIWNMLSEFADPSVRDELGVKVASGSSFQVAASDQFDVAAHLGFMVGKTGCPEQMRQVTDCTNCRTAASPRGPHCVQKFNAATPGRYDINFAFHPGKGRQEQIDDEACRQSWGLPAAEAAAKARLKARGYVGRGGKERYAAKVIADGLKPINGRP